LLQRGVGCELDFLDRGRRREEARCTGQRRRMSLRAREQAPRQIRLRLEGRCSMWSILPAAAILFTQAQSDLAEKWCFERGQHGAQLCEGTETACNNLLKVNPEIATGPCLRVQPDRTIRFDGTARTGWPNRRRESSTAEAVRVAGPVTHADIGGICYRDGGLFSQLRSTS
jgi:hypothetical protein